MIVAALNPRPSFSKQVDTMSQTLIGRSVGSGSHPSISKQRFARKSTTSTDLWQQQQQQGILLEPGMSSGSHTTRFIHTRPTDKERHSGMLVRRRTTQASMSGDLTRICIVPDSDDRNKDEKDQPPAVAKWRLRQEELHIDHKGYPTLSLLVPPSTPTRSCIKKASSSTSHIWDDAFGREYPPIVKEMRIHNIIVVIRGRFEIRLEASLSQ